MGFCSLKTLYNFYRKCAEIGKKVKFKISNPGLELEENVEYIASYIML